jgi:hypothetical protein
MAAREVVAKLGSLCPSANAAMRSLRSRFPESAKLLGAKFFCCKKIRPTTAGRYGLNHVAEVTSKFSSGDEVPHIFTRKSRVQPKEILTTSEKGLLQQYLPSAVRAKACDQYGTQETTSEFYDR